MLVNNSPTTITQSNKGRLYGQTSLIFEDVDGNLIDKVDMEIYFTFYNNSHIVLKIVTNATNVNVGLVNNYVKVNGLKLRIIENAYYSSQLLTDEVVYE